MELSYAYFSLLAVPLALLIVSSRLRAGPQYSLKALSYAALAAIAFSLHYAGLVDVLSLIYGAASAYVSLFASICAERYVEKKGYSRRVALLIDLFAFSMIASFLSPSILGLVVAWTAAELLGYEITSAGTKRSLEGYTGAPALFLFLSSMTFELSIFMAVYAYAHALPSIAPSPSMELLHRALLSSFQDLSRSSVSAPEYLLTLATIGFVAKSAQVPLHFWLVSTHVAAPSPASALLSGVMTSMGVYGLLRLGQIFSLSTYTLYWLLTIAVVSIIYGGLQAFLQRDGKQLLAYSTIMGNGFSTLLLVLYFSTKSVEALVTLLVSVLAHMSYKSTLFLDIGLVEQAVGFRYLHRLRGLSSIVPYSTMAAVVAVLSLIGAPPTIGFASKLFAATLALTNAHQPEALAALFATIVYMVLSIMVGLSYVRIHFGAMSADLARMVSGSVDTMQQIAAFLNGLSSVLFILAMLVQVQLYGVYVLVNLLSAPLLILMLYLTSIVARRE